jgi:hypothetical protein
MDNQEEAIEIVSSGSDSDCIVVVLNLARDLWSDTTNLSVYLLVMTVY